MKKAELLMEQVKKTALRTQSAVEKATEKTLHQLSAGTVDTVLDASNSSRTTEPNIPLISNEMKQIIGEKAFTDSVSLDRLNDFISYNDVNISEFTGNPVFRERIIKGDETQDVNYLWKGSIVARSVGRVCIVNEAGEDEGYGTGFLIAPGVLITNNHVLPEASLASHSYIEFDYEKGENELPRDSEIFMFDKDRLFYTNKELDFTIVAVQQYSADNQTYIREYGFLRLNPQLGKTKEGLFVSIIQHPGGQMKKVAIRENRVTNLQLPRFIRYTTDTQQGSSGAPVFNDKWEVVALHHSGIPKYIQVNGQDVIANLQGQAWEPGQGEEQIDWVENEGVRASSIVIDITTNAARNFPFLLEHIKPLEDLDMVRRSMGSLDSEVYYPQEADNQERDAYYAKLEGGIQNADFDKLHKLLQQTLTTPRNYSPSKYVYPKVDVYPDGFIRSVYSGKRFTSQELILADKRVDLERQLKLVELAQKENAQMISKEDYENEMAKVEEALPYNCEHVVPQSWFGKQEPMRGDLHHLFACESGCNSFRSNYPFHDFPHYKPAPNPDEKLRDKCGNQEQGKFEPEFNKGVVARAVLYFLVMYKGRLDQYANDAIEMLKDWSNDQPVTAYELHRNREIFKIQGNRNPFIDFPEWVDEIDFKQSLR